MGASWVREEILEKNPRADLAVYAVWLPTLAGDARGRWDRKVLDDPRVTHLWDGAKLTGSRFADVDVGAPRYGGVLWDAYLLYGPDARWEQEPAPLLGAGRTIIAKSSNLQREIDPLLR